MAGEFRVSIWTLASRKFLSRYARRGVARAGGTFIFTEAVRMLKKKSENALDSMSNADYVPDPDIEEFMEQEISRAPKDPGHLAQRLRNNTAASPSDAGGDIDASWEEVNSTGAESFGGHNPTPDQSDVEENAHAYGIDFQDNEPLDLLEKMEKRDRNRFELDENSKSEGDMI